MRDDIKERPRGIRKEFKVPESHGYRVTRIGRDSSERDETKELRKQYNKKKKVFRGEEKTRKKR
jgi:hypothetical protein